MKNKSSEKICSNSDNFVSNYSYSETNSKQKDLKIQFKYFWKQALDEIKNQIDPKVFQVFFSKLNFINVSDDKLIISCPSDIIKDYIENRYTSKLASKFNQLFNAKANTKELYQIKLNVNEKNSSHSNVINYVQKKEQNPSNSKSTPPFRINHLKSTLNPDYNFDNYIVGDFNQFAYGIAKQLATGKQQEKSSANPLFFYGGVGLGKTHLMQAVGNLYLEHNPQSRVYYTSSENFTNKLVAAIKNGKIDRFKKQIRSIDLLLIDDFQFLANKTHTQEEFFHTFNALYESGKKIIVTADKLPQDINNLDEKIKNRLSWGITADFQAPSFKDRLKIIESKAKLKNVNLNKDVIHLIAEKITTNTREIEGALNRVIALASLRKEEVSRGLVETSLQTLIKPKVLEISHREIKAIVANFFELKISDLESKRRKKTISFARQVAIYLIRKHTDTSYLEIGLFFGGRDHSSIMYAAKKIEDALSNCPKTKKIINELENKILT